VASLVLDSWLQVARRPVADDDGNPADDVIDFRSVGEARCELRPVAMLVLFYRVDCRQITRFVTTSNFGALDRSETITARIASHDRLVVVCRPQIRNQQSIHTPEHEDVVQTSHK